MDKSKFSKIINSFNLDDAISKAKERDEDKEEFLSRTYKGILDGKKKARKVEGKDDKVRTEIVWRKVIAKLIHKGYKLDKTKYKNVQELAKKMDEMMK